MYEGKVESCRPGSERVCSLPVLQCIPCKIPLIDGFHSKNTILEGLQNINLPLLSLPFFTQNFFRQILLLSG